MRLRLDVVIHPHRGALGSGDFASGLSVWQSLPAMPAGSAVVGLQAWQLGFRRHAKQLQPGEPCAPPSSLGRRRPRLESRTTLMWTWLAQGLAEASWFGSLSPSPFVVTLHSRCYSGLVCDVAAAECRLALEVPFWTERGFELA